MENQDEASKAIKELDGTTLDDRKIVVNEAKPKRDNY
jgi:RNA recognition motif-containing protein